MIILHLQLSDEKKRIDLEKEQTLLCKRKICQKHGSLDMLQKNMSVEITA